MAAEVKACSCKHEGQDRIHGSGRRVWNGTTKGWRCTVCGTEKVASTVKGKK